MKRMILFPVYGLVLLAGLFAAMLGSNLHTWHRLTDESPVAELTFEQTGPREFRATLAWGDFCTAQTYQLTGDQWRLDARFLKWQPWANLFGFDSIYRIERLGSRYFTVVDELGEPLSVHDLHNAELPDLTEIMGRYPGRLSPVDTLYGSSVYDRMDEQHVYRVYRGQSGLLVRKLPRLAEAGAAGGFTIPINTQCQ